MMVIRKNKDSEIIVKAAINLAFNISYKSAAELMARAGISASIIDRILYAFGIARRRNTAKAA